MGNRNTPKLFLRTAEKESRTDNSEAFKTFPRRHHQSSTPAAVFGAGCAGDSDFTHWTWGISAMELPFPVNANVPAPEPPVPPLPPPLLLRSSSRVKKIQKYLQKSIKKYVKGLKIHGTGGIKWIYQIGIKFIVTGGRSSVGCFVKVLGYLYFGDGG
jgi:hypothetical protein